MFPSRRIIRFFLIYGFILFAVDRLLIPSSRSVVESFALVLVAELVAILLYSLLIKLVKRGDNDF